MQIQETQEFPEQLLCPICMGVFAPPVTIQCGHTFCRKCLLNSVSIKLLCPVCRKSLTTLSDKPIADESLNKIIQSFRTNKIKINKQRSNLNEKLLESSENFLLIDIRTSDLLLPFTKVTATFQLQSPTLLNRLNRFIARQQHPFNHFGVVSTIIEFNQMSHTLYKCVIEGKEFCEIVNQTVQKNMELNEQFFYRNCSAKIIHEQQDGNIDEQIFNKFYSLLCSIRNRKTIQNVYKVINSQVLNNRNDNLAMFYSVAKLVAIDNKEKYTIITTFDKHTRKIWLQKFINQINYDVSQNAEKFINISSEGFMKNIYGILLGFVFIYFLIVLNNNQNASL